MNKFLSLIAVVLIFLSDVRINTYAQWNLQSPVPTGRDLNGVSFVSPTHIFVCGENHYLLESTNGGLNWITRISDEYSTDPYYMVYFSDATHGYILGNAGQN